MAQVHDESSVPEAYKYSWSSCSELSISDFVQKFKPSMVQDDGTKPWIYVSGSSPPESGGPVLEAINEASKVLSLAAAKVEEIKVDESIPTRSNKKTGAKSKKELREAVQADATKKFEDISLSHGFTCGKWLIFSPPDKVDAVWSSVAKSLVDGPLASTAAFQAKVATSPQLDQPNYQHVICIYMPNVYDKEAVTEVMKILLRNHGMTLSGVKSDLYTSIGLDSKHPSGIQSTVWKNSALMKDTEMKELKEAYFAGLKDKAVAVPAVATLTESDREGDASSLKAKAGRVPPKKRKAEDVFESDDEVTSKTKVQKPSEDSELAAKAKKTKTKPRKKEEDIFEDD